ncbi:hypothetical protein JG687_00000316 [Phytophthora cactorum]|uniref:Cytochrome b5 heme-binding domain-containing protein n=1 Tax=Phytophthora cactorum TaxID=29920 RepID=A0A8T1V0D3_9STRA|nr:hypothetical protein JG687_00000316 [Phytophthora cactorum]
MPWNANNNPAGEIRAPAMAAALRLKQQGAKGVAAVWTRSLRVEELDELDVNHEQLASLRHSAQPPAAPIETDAKDFAAAFAKFTWQRVLTEHERLVMPYKDGRSYFVRVLEIDAEDEDETEFTMPDSYRGRVDEDAQVFVSSEGGQSPAFELLNVTPINSAGLASMRSDVVTVLTNDEEEFPVKKKLLFPCIRLSSAVLSGKGVHKDASTTIEVDVDCCTFDRVLLYLEHEARNDGTEFNFDPSVTDDLFAAAITVGCIGLQEVCQRRFGEFETRVRKEAIRWEEVVRRNQSGEVWLVMQGMVLDITRWIPEHPGGSELIAQEAMNVDSTVMFEIYHASRQSFRYLKQFYIGELSEFDISAMPKPKEQPSEAFIQELQQYTTWRIKPQEHTFKSF